MAQNIDLLGAQYSDVPAVTLPKVGGGTASFTDVTGTTAIAGDVAQGKYFFTANGTLTLGTNQGGSGDGSVWQDGNGYVHLSDEEGTNVDVDALTITSGGTYTAPTGHAYSPVTVASGSATPASSISGTGASVSAGTNTLTLSKTVSNTPQVSAGYVSSGTAGNSSVSLTASVNTRSSSDLTASGATVTAPAGYYASSASKSVASGTEGTPTASKGTVSNHSVTVTPSVTNTTGYITGSTINGTGVSVSASELVSGTKSITANGTGIDVTDYASVDVAVSGSSPTLITKSITQNGTYDAEDDNADGYSSVTVNVSGGGAIKKGVIRPDSTLVQSWTLDKMLVDDLEYSIPAYSTSAQTIASSGTLFNTNVSISFGDYVYYVVSYGLTVPKYSSNTLSAGRFGWASNISLYESYYYDKTLVKPLDASGNSGANLTSLSLNTTSSNTILYRTSSNWSITSGNYGTYLTFAQPTIASDYSTINIKSPALMMRGFNTYFNETWWNLVTDVRYQYSIELYRVPVSTVSVNGWGVSSLYQSILNDINNNNGTLT